MKCKHGVNERDGITCAFCSPCRRHAWPIQATCPKCAGADEYGPAKEYTRRKTLGQVINELHFSLESGSLARDQDLYTCLVDLRNSVTDGFTAIDEEMCEMQAKEVL